MVGLAQRLAEIEGVRQQQEGTIIAKQEENTAASSQIKVSVCMRERERERERERCIRYMLISGYIMYTSHLVVSIVKNVLIS